MYKIKQFVKENRDEVIGAVIGFVPMIVLPSLIVAVVTHAVTKSNWEIEQLHLSTNQTDDFVTLVHKNQKITVFRYQK